MDTPTPAQIIADQLGRGTLYMLGARGTVCASSDGRSLCFQIKGCRHVNAIKITLDPSDTYTVEFRKIGNARSGFRMSVVREVEGVYADSLHTLIERETGLATRL